MASSVAAPRGQLCLRSTFIDFEIEAAQEEPGNTRRSRSVPASRSRASSSEIFDEERAYVSELSETLASLWAAMASGEQFGSNAVCGSPGGPAPPLAHSNMVSMASCVVNEMYPLPKGAGLDLPATPTDGTASPTDDSPTLAPFLGGDSDRAGSFVEDPAHSQGSMGHPFLCSRPCLYFASGQCVNGVACDFCHLSLPKRPAHLDKKHREALRAMPAEQAKALMFPVVREKVLALDASPAAVGLLQELAFACEVALGAPAPTATRSDRTLIVALEAMSLRVVLTSLQRAALDGEVAARSAAEALMGRLRGATIFAGGGLLSL